MTARIFALVGIALLVLSGLAYGVSIEDFGCEEHFWGMSWEPEDLKDRVVLVYFWAAD
ncbi:MAG: hypothetical protein ACYTHM_23780 [Planctomycetota bacterium]|jgi:hypothetical protein